MKHHYVIWGKYGTDKLESLMVETVNGGYIQTIAQANAIIRYWQDKAEQGTAEHVRDWRIAKIDLSTKPDFAAAIN
ncbi:MAG: hypothetical protein VW496_01715 [Pelagibacteraceae bacterium]